LPSYILVLSAQPGEITKDQMKEVDFLQRDKVHLIELSGPTEIHATVKVRRGQHFFRQSILSAYGVRCCISGINIPHLLIASHIKPWRDCSDHDRLSPRNGLCLSKLHDAAFDAGLITLDDKLTVVLGQRLRSFFPQPALEQSFVPFEGKTIQLPNKLVEPDPAFLAYHRNDIFGRVNR
jgi:putative restriction endonuclease